MSATENFPEIDKFSGALLFGAVCTQGHDCANPKKKLKHESVKKRCFGKFPGIAHVHSLRAAYGGIGWCVTVWNDWSKVSTMKQDVFFSSCSYFSAKNGFWALPVTFACRHCCGCQLTNCDVIQRAAAFARPKMWPFMFRTGGLNFIFTVNRLEAVPRYRFDPLK